MADGDSDKVGEYFELQKTIKLLRRDLKEIKEQHEAYNELQKLNKKVKELRDKVKDDEEIKTLTEKISETKERFDLVKELIRMNLIENSQEHVKRNGKALKLVYVIKEVKEEDA